MTEVNPDRGDAPAPRVLPMGETALLAELGSLADVVALHAALAATLPAGVVDLVPAARTVLVRVDPSVLPVTTARSWIERAAAGGGAATEPVSERVVDLPVRYDGADLPDVAALLGLSAEALAARHAEAQWTVAFTGFAPGFGYLVAEDWPFDVPRRATPRTRVPAGAVGLAGEFAGAYPRESPGGWQLIGSTDAVLFDPAAAEPVLLAPGARVRFRPTREAVHAASGSDRPAARSGPTEGADAVLRVVAAGVSATVQDQGRPGHSSEGIAVSGAADRGALRVAHRLLGTSEAAAGIEVLLGGFRAVALRETWFAVTGAWGTVRLDGRPLDPYTAHRWPAGSELDLAPFAHGARAYLALRGGVDAPRSMGSRSTDTLAGLGPSPLRAGDVLRTAGETVADIPAADLHPWGPPPSTLEVALAPGPRADWFTEAARIALYEAEWVVTTEADRVGVRLDGPALERRVGGELPSEGMLPGALQVPPSGRPVVLGPDGPVTGGYPVIAVVAEADLDRWAQAVPGTRVRFRHARGRTAGA